MSVDSDEKLWNLPPEEYAKRKIEYAQKIKNEFDKFWPDVFNKIEILDSATPQTFKKWVNYYGAYGIKRKLNAVSVIPLTKIPGLFLTGQALVSPGLIGAMISAFLLDKIIERANV